jgi:pilus assembly protein CpaE
VTTAAGLKVLVLDDVGDLSEQLERVTAAARPPTRVVQCRGFDEVEAAIRHSEAFDVLVAGPSASRGDGLQELRRLRAWAPRISLVLAVDRWRSGALRDTVRTGAVDLLRLPVSDEVLLEAIEQALEIGSAGTPSAVEDEGPDGGPGTVVAVVSATGGCGKTFFATNLAYYLQSRSRQRTCLIDLDLQFGELSTALRLKPTYTLHDLLSPDADQEDLVHRLEEHLVRHESGIQVLAAPDEPVEADVIDALDVARVIQAARSRFDYVIVDTPAALSESVLAALEQADQIFALATLDLPSVRNLGVMLSTLRQLKVPEDRVKLLLNKVEPDAGIDVDRVVKHFPQGFSMVIPYGREVNRSLNMGQPVLAYAPRGEVSRALECGLSEAMAGELAGSAPTRPRRRRWLGRRQKRPA